MTFSVIIPTFNRGDFISITLQAVLDQTCADLEVIVVDDGSTDNTGAVIASFKDERIRYFYKNNEERSIARNFGAEKASGRYLIFLDSDDHMQPSHLEKIIQYLAQYNFVPRFLFTGFTVLDANGAKVHAFIRSGLFDKQKLHYGNYLGCSPVVVETELFKKHWFNEHRDLVIFEDWELWLRIAAEEPLHCIPAGTITMINHAGRSVLNFNAEALIRKAEYFRSITRDKMPRLLSSAPVRKIFDMGLYSYVALHIALARKDRGLAIKYLFKALRSYPGLLIKRRFYAIVRRLI